MLGPMVRAHLPLMLCVAGLVACDDAPPPSPQSASSVAVSASAAPATTAPPERRMPVEEWKLLARNWMPPKPIPNFELVSHEGNKFRLRDIAQGHVFVGLIFTSCSVEKACPLTTQKMFELGRLWKKVVAAGEQGDKSLHLLSLTFDPENDTPEVLAKYGEIMLKEIPNWTFATGPIELMEETLPRMFGVLAQDHPKAGKAHNVKAALLGPGLVPLEEWKDNDFDPQDIVDSVLK